ncbi:MAG TPA: NAD(P)H-binding protein [Anaeromyxobacter sp.]
MAAKRRGGGEEGTVLVTGATGFVGRALVQALVAAGHRVRATTRARRPGLDPSAEWVTADLRRAETLAPALRGVRSAYFLVHGMSGAREDYAEEERLAAAVFAREAARAGVERIVYLGGVAPRGPPSKHLASRLAVGTILRGGRVPALELRASMIVGAGSESWRIVRDLALRLPALVLPRWARSRSRPVALEDVVKGLVAALHLPLEESEWFDLPGPEVLTVRQILERVAALRGRRIPSVDFPLPAPRLSSLWLRLVSDANFDVARELVQGLASDLLPRDDRYWSLTGHGPLLRFADAARRALEAEAPSPGVRGLAMAIEEALVARLSPQIAGDAGGRPDGRAPAVPARGRPSRG